MAEMLKYYVAACQTDLPNPVRRSEMKRNTARLAQMIDYAVIGYAPFLPVKLVVFPEFAHSAPVFLTAKKLREKLAVPIPNEHTQIMQGKAHEYGLYIQTGSMLEADPAWPGAVFNTTCLIGPEGILYKYRKVNPWIPWEVNASPHDLHGYKEELFPVANTPIGKIGAAICYDWLFPETLRQLAANGAEILIRVSAYMDPFGTAEPMDWWTVVNRCRAIENTAYVVAANQGASLKHYPPFSWPGGSMVVDYDGRILAQATPGPGERIVVAPVDLEMLRHERKARRAHQMLAHLRSECYPMYRKSFFPPGTMTEDRNATVTGRELQIDRAKRRIGFLEPGEAPPVEGIQALLDRALPRRKRARKKRIT
jgi:formamidase